MKNFVSNVGVKTVAVLLCIACLVGGVCTWVVSGFYWDAIFYGERQYLPSVSMAMNEKFRDLQSWLNYAAMKDGQELDYLARQNYEALTQKLDPSATNFRFIVRNPADGQVVAASGWAGEGTDDPLPKMENTRMRSYQVDQYGPDGVIESRECLVEFGVDPALPVQDRLSAALAEDPIPGEWVVSLAFALTAASVVLLIFLCVCAGRRQGVEEICRGWQDKIPLELYSVLMGCALFFTGAGVVVGIENLIFYPNDPYENYLKVLLIGCMILCATFSVATLMSLATRLKSRTLLKNSYVWRILCWLGRLLLRLGGWWEVTFGGWPITRRMIALFFLYLLVSALSVFTIIGFPIVQGFAIYLLCRWVKEWKAIREGTQAIVGGNPGAEIDTAGLKHFPDLKEHADQLNDLGNAINSAVEERMKSERMKSELITNVSHDLKTPLTSIINYVDLLKKEDVQGERAREYIEVLDRKSQRLKKLTEDLVEASKASTGTLVVSRERLDLTQLVNQGVGEYQERLALRSLTLMVELPQEPVIVMADGRHLWRVLDNLLGNCAKYAMEGTRVYLDLVRWDGAAVLTVKNISAEPLNLPPEQLMERFVRGEESRTTEGSGLGLSIARSLTELQGGVFRLDIDGDLFKAIVRLPEGK